MNLQTVIRRRTPTCPTCQQAIVPPTPSKVVLFRVAMAGFAVASGLLEYRRALKRETEAAQLEQLHDTSPDVPLDEHLADLSTVDKAQDLGNVVEPTPWPPSHPSLAALDDDQAPTDAD